MGLQIEDIREWIPDQIGNGRKVFKNAPVRHSALDAESTPPLCHSALDAESRISEKMDSHFRGNDRGEMGMTPPLCHSALDAESRISEKMDSHFRGNDRGGCHSALDAESRIYQVEWR